MADAVDTLRKAFQETERVIAGVKPEHLSQSTPCVGWDLRALLNHTVGAITLFATAASGNSFEGFDPNAERIGDDPLGAFQQAAAAALHAWSGEGVLEGTVVLPPGEMPGSIGININLFDTYIHAWDIAQATGQAFTLDPELATVAYDTVKNIIQPALRQPGGPFGPELSVPDNASVGDKLLAFAGRQP